jgi:hypothetical protein
VYAKFLILLLTLLGCNSCYLRHYPVTKEVAAQGVYLVTVPDYGTGTAWGVDKNHLVTAGHVCHGLNKGVVVYRNDKYIHGTIIGWEYDGELKDLCLIRTDMPVGSLVISDRDPVPGEQVRYTGYPALEYYEGQGIYLGDTDGPHNNMNNATVNIPCAKGASGSPLYIDNGVWGVLVRLRTDGGVVHDGSDGCAAIPRAALVAFLNAYKVNYTMPPEPPDSDF